MSKNIIMRIVKAISDIPLHIEKIIEIEAITKGKDYPKDAIFYNIKKNQIVEHKIETWFIFGNIVITEKGEELLFLEELE